MAATRLPVVRTLIEEWILVAAVLAWHSVIRQRLKGVGEAAGKAEAARRGLQIGLGFMQGTPNYLETSNPPQMLFLSRSSKRSRRSSKSAAWLQRKEGIYLSGLRV